MRRYDDRRSAAGARPCPAAARCDCRINVGGTPMTQQQLPRLLLLQAAGAGAAAGGTDTGGSVLRHAGGVAVDGGTGARRMWWHRSRLQAAGRLRRWQQNDAAAVSGRLGNPGRRSRHQRPCGKQAQCGAALALPVRAAPADSGTATGAFRPTTDDGESTRVSAWSWCTGLVHGAVTRSQPMTRRPRSPHCCRTVRRHCQHLQCDAGPESPAAHVGGATTPRRGPAARCRPCGP